MTRSAITVTVQASDQESGLAGAAYSADGGSTWTEQASFTLEEGIPLTICVRDQAGNTAERVVCRNEFPYPPEPAPSPAPAPSPSSAPTTPASSQESADTVQDTTLSETEKTQEKEAGQKEEAGKEGTDKEGDTGRAQQENAGERKDGKEQEKTEKQKQEKKAQEGAEQKTQDQETQEKEIQGKETQDEEALEQENRKQKDFLVERLWEETAGVKDKEAWENGMKLEKGGEDTAESGEAQPAETAGQEGKNGQNALVQWLGKRAAAVTGGLLLLAALVLLLRMLWLHSGVLYCYNGGEEYRRLAVVYLRRKKEEFELELPAELLSQRGTPRYRLLLKNRFVKQHASMDLVLKSEKHRARYPLEECVDFVL